MRFVVNGLQDLSETFAAGVIDSIQLPKVVGTIAKYPRLRQVVLNTALLNGVVLIGSIYFYEYAVGPLISGTIVQISSLYPELPIAENISIPIEPSVINAILSSLYYMLWIYPIFALSFIFNSVWYQDVADLASIVAGKQVKREVERDRALNERRSKAGNILTWISKHLADEIFRTVLQYLVMLEGLLISYIPYVGPCLSFFVFAELYSLWAFEYLWQHLGLGLDRRLALVEKRWVYFLGFGTPVTALTFVMSLVTSSAVFAIVFPLSIIAAAYSKPRSLRGHPEAKGAPSEILWIPRHIPIFYVARTVLGALLRWQIRPQEQRKGTSASNDSTSTQNSPREQALS
eukprot:Clim_evm8s149 gene=Clim_evmTU8s149